MPDGTIQDSRQQPDGQNVEKKWGYLKVRDPKEGDPGNCAWNEYMLYLDAQEHNLSETTNCTFSVELAEIEYPINSGNKRPIEIAIIQGTGNAGVPLNWFRQIILKEAPELAKTLKL